MGKYQQHAHLIKKQAVERHVYWEPSKWFPIGQYHVFYVAQRSPEPGHLCVHEVYSHDWELTQTSILTIEAARMEVSILRINGGKKQDATVIPEHI